MKVLSAVKKVVVPILAGLSLVMLNAGAAEKSADPKMQKSAPAGMQGGMDPANMQQMQQSMMKMHELMHQIQSAKTPAEREKLQQQHMQMMQSHMQMMMPMMMQGMGGQGGTSGGGMGLMHGPGGGK